MPNEYISTISNIATENPNDFTKIQLWSSQYLVGKNVEDKKKQKENEDERGRNVKKVCGMDDSTNRQKLDALTSPVYFIDNLPIGSFLMTIEFQLQRPYISKGNNPFHLHENPILRDRAFQLPVITETTWKGAFKNAFSMINNDEENIKLLFGDTERRGRLHFFPTFFGRTTVEVINPHDRKTKKGTQPIYIDAAGVNNNRTSFESGKFCVLYCPFDQMGGSVKNIRISTLDIAHKVYEAAIKMMELGVSGKKSSGYGAMKESGLLIKIKTQIDLAESKEVKRERLEAIWPEHL